MSVTELFANQPFTTVISGGTGPDTGSEMWTVSSSTPPFPTAQTGISQFHVTDTDTTAASEIILVTNTDPVMNVWTVTRGAEGTTPVAHEAGFTVTQVLTAGWLNDVAGSNLPATSAGAVLYGNPAADAAWLAGPTASTKEFLASTGSSGTANTPQWGTISAADVPVLNQNTTGTAATAVTAGNVTGIVAVLNGGTGGTSATAYAVVTGGTAATTPFQQVSGLGSSGQILTSNGAGSLPTWQPNVALVNPMTTHGDMLYESAGLAPAALAGNTSSAKNFLTSTGSGGTANSPAWGTIAALDVPTLNQSTTGTSSNVTGIVAVVNGGTGGTQATAYTLMTAGTAAAAPFQQVSGTGSSGQVLTSGGAGSLPAWANAPVDWLNVITGYGATGNGKRSVHGAMTSGGSTLTISPDALFAAGDVGKLVMVDGAGGTNVPLSGTIAAFTNSSTVTLNTTASASGTAQTVYWGTDDTSAIQAAVTAAGKTSQSDNQYLTGNAQAVFLPWAIYMISAPIVPPASQSFVLYGDYATVVGASSAIINFNRSPGEGVVEIAGIWFEGCGGHVMENISIHGNASIHDCNAVLRNPAYSLFYMDDVARADGHITALYQAEFRNISWWLGPGTRSIEAWHMVSTGGAELTDIHFINLNGPNPPGSTPSGQDNTQYQFYIGCTDTSYSTNISWKDCLAASLYGGYIKIDNAKNVTIDGLNVYNTYVESNPNDLIAFQTNATGGNACHAISVRNVSVNNALGTGSPPPPYHISFTAACSGIIVENCVGGWASNGLTINNGGATGALYLNNPVSQSGYPIISNKVADTIVASAGSVATQTLAVSGSLSTTLASVTQTGGGKILQLTGPASGGGEAFAYALAGDTSDRFYLSPGGHALFFGSGSATQDVQLFRSGAGTLSVQATTNAVPLTLNVTASTAQTSTVPLSQLTCHNSGDLAQTIQISTDTVARFKADSNGKQQWGAGGTAATDTDLYRASAGLLQTDGNFTVGGTLTAGVPLAVTSGGSGGTAVTSYAVVTGGTSATTPLQTVSGLGTAGQGLLSSGAGSLPVWQTTVNSVTATDTSIVVTNSNPAAPTIATATLDVIATDHPPVASVAMAGQKLTGLAYGSGTADSMALGQLPQVPGPGANQLLAWSHDPAMNGTNTGTIAQGGALYLAAFALYYPTTLSKIWWINTVAGTTPTAGESQVGIYSSGGTLVASATTTATATAVTTTGTLSVSLSSPYAAPPGSYWVGMIFQAATEPVILRTGTNNGNYLSIGTTNATYRWCVNGTGGTAALPATINTLSNTLTGSMSYWVGVS